MNVVGDGSNPFLTKARLRYSINANRRCDECVHCLEILTPPASLPTNPNLPVIPLPLFEDLPLIPPTPAATVKIAKLTVNSVPPKPNTKRSILTLQPKLPCTKRSENTTFRRKRKLSGALVNVDDGSDEEPTVKLFKQHETPAPVVLGVPSEAHRRKRNKIDDPPKWIVQTKERNKDLEEPKKKKKKEATLDLSQHSILPNASYVAHLPKKQQMNTLGEDDVFFDALSDEKKNLEEPKKKNEKEVALDLSQHSILPNASYMVNLPKKQQMNTLGEDDVFFDALSDEKKNLEEPKKKNEKEVALDLSQHSILPNASYVAHLPKKQQMNTSDEDDVFFDALSDQGDLFADISILSDSQKPDSSNEYRTTETYVSQLTVTSSTKFSKAETPLEALEEELAHEATKELTPVLEENQLLKESLL
ncbi:unnamed protein product [Rhizopus stolonifer]